MRQIKTLVAAGSLVAFGITAERAGALDVGGKLEAPQGVVQKAQKGGGNSTGGGGSPSAPSAGAGNPGGGSSGAASPGRGGGNFSAPGSGSARGMRSGEGGPSAGIRSGSRAMRGYDAQPIHRGNRHHRRGRGSDFGVYYGYEDDCAYLHRRAVRSASSYWWRRYSQCVS